MSYQCRRWVFTWYDAEDPEVPPEYQEEWMSYLLCGLETCPTTGRKHWQGYLELGRKSTLAGLKARGGLWATCHLEQAQGSWEDQLEYCSKESEPFEWGTPMQPGKRTDLRALCAGVLQGSFSVTDVLRENPSAIHTYGRTLIMAEEAYQATLTRGAWAPPTVYWYWGPTGLGKTRKAMQEASTQSGGLYLHRWSDGHWWDKYHMEENVVLDEFRGQLPFAELLGLLDGYETSVPRRNRAPTPFMARRIWITSSKHPRYVYDADKIGEAVEQLLRRLTTITEFVVPL